MFEKQSLVSLSAGIAAKRASGMAAERTFLPLRAPSPSRRASAGARSRPVHARAAHRPALSSWTNRDSPVATRAKCAWTGRGGAVSSAFTARRTGIDMAGMGGRTGGRGDGAHGAHLPGPARIDLAPTDAPAGRGGGQPGGAQARSAPRSGRRIPDSRRSESRGVLGRIAGTGAYGAALEGGGWVARATACARSGKNRANPDACAELGGTGAACGRDWLTRDNCCYRESIGPIRRVRPAARTQRSRERANASARRKSIQPAESSTVFPRRRPLRAARRPIGANTDRARLTRDNILRNTAAWHDSCRVSAAVGSVSAPHDTPPRPYSRC